MPEALDYRGRKAEVEQIIKRGLGTRDLFDEDYYPIPARPAFVTKDSGQRQEFDSGMRRDTQEGKPRFDLTPPADLSFEAQMLTRWAALMARGAEKYGDRNWEKASGSEELARFRASAFRHFMQWYYDAEDGEDHAAAVFFNVQGAEFVEWKLAQEDVNPPVKQPPGLECLRCHAKTYTLYYGRCRDCESQVERTKVTPQETAPDSFRDLTDGEYF